MSASRFFITVFPTAEVQALQWWLVDDSALKAKGCDTDPLFAAGIKMPSGEGEQPESERITCIALMPSVPGVVRWYDVGHDSGDEQENALTDQQILAAARLSAREQSLNRENVHIAAVTGGAGRAVTASVGKDVMASGLLKLEALGIDPDLVVPAGWMIEPQEDAVIEADFGFEKLLRGAQMIAPDEPDLRAHLVGDSTVIVLSDEAVDRELASAAQNVVSGKALNLRSGDFAKKVRRSLTARQKRILGWLAVAVLVVSVLIPVIHLVKYHWAADDADKAALAVAEPLVGSVENVEEADRLLSERLISENRGNIAFSVPASALFSAVQQSAGVSIEKISYRRDGTVSAGLSAVRAEDINPALIAIQKAGFIITATPRTDATGAAKADITVRAP